MTENTPRPLGKSSRLMMSGSGSVPTREMFSRCEERKSGSWARCCSSRTMNGRFNAT